MKANKEEIRLYFEDRGRDGRPEMLIERYIDNERVFSIFAFATSKNGKYDKVRAKGGAKGDPAFDAQDDAFYIQLANAAANLFN